MNRIKDGSSCQEGSSSGCTAGDFICQQNGFEYAEFVGTKDSYLDFVKGIIKQIRINWVHTMRMCNSGYVYYSYDNELLMVLRHALYFE